MFVAGHPPPLRKAVFRLTVGLAHELVPLCAKMLAMKRGLKDWEGGVDDAPQQTEKQ